MFALYPSMCGDANRKISGWKARSQIRLTIFIYKSSPRSSKADVLVPTS